ncbi:MAG: GspE/PulE family protein [Patescibacteria group bacterium]
MPEFNESKQERKYKQLREQEEEDVMKTLSEKYGIPYVDLTSISISPDALVLIHEDVARAAHIAAFNVAEKALDVAVHSPNDPETQKALDALTNKGFTPSVFLTSTKSLVFAWERYKDFASTTASRRGMLDISSDEIEKFVADVHDIETVKKHIEETLTLKKAFRTSRIAEVLVAGALATHSSDIHIEPEEASVRLRMRLDGILTDVIFFDHETYRLLLSRIKLLSGLKLNVQQEAQDGRFSIRMGKADIEIRTSILPGQYGESIVMRVLNPDTISASIEVLGMRKELLDVLIREIAKPNGLILNTGPTGSGKTTTLYAFLRKVHTPEIKILTIEDPIEYHLPGVVQTQVDAEKEYTFSSGLRAALRQDPDVIMVGEIRDNETAEIAIHAALTGHLVFSTLHTNSAAGAFTRLIDLGINPRVLGSAVSVALAQRLVRKLCEKCKKEVSIDAETKIQIDTVLQTVTKQEKITGLQRDHMWVSGGGCPACGGMGYKGRMGLFEAVFMDAKIEDVIEMSPSEREIKKVSAEQGFFTMAQDGIIKILEGQTSLEEVIRVIDITD